jgi:hypothetical protein
MNTTAIDAQQITDTYWTLTPGAGHAIRLLAVYEMFDWTLERFHTAVLHLARAEWGNVFVEPEPCLRNTTDLERWASVRIGGDIKHNIAIEHR